MAPEAALGFQPRRELETALQLRRLEIEDRQEVFAGESGWRHQVRYSALIRTYSALRSHVHTVDDASPAPRSTLTAMSFPARCSAARGAFSSYGRPRSNNTVDPMATAARDSSNRTPARPATAMRRPQLGSPPWIAVFTSGELAIAFAARRAS